MNKKLAVLPLSALLLSVSASVSAGMCCEPPPPRCDILFDTNNDQIRSSEKGEVAALAQRMVNEPQLKITLEGHADERSNPEYNLDLALRRAWHTKRALVAQGAGDNMIHIETYGEEAPLASGSGEPVWQKNRCVNIVE
ncbi:MAG: OmpA family protein [Pseudomonadota bacterium]